MKYVGVVVPVVLLPKIVNGEAEESVNASDGVVEDVVTVVVKIGVSPVAVKFVTVPAAAFDQTGVPPPIEVREMKES